MNLKVGILCLKCIVLPSGFIRNINTSWQTKNTEKIPINIQLLNFRIRSRMGSYKYLKVESSVSKHFLKLSILILIMRPY